MSRATGVALACYPPSWKERYGDELADLTTDGDAIDLLKGAARAWSRPAGPRTLTDRRLRAVGTVHVSWCAAFVAGAVFSKAVDDPPLPGLTTGASQPLWGLVRAAFALGWLVLLVGGAALLLRIAVPAVRRRQWRVLRPLLRPLLPGATLLVLVLGGIPVVGSYGNRASSFGSLLAIAVWLGLGLALVISGALGPVLALRRSDLDARALRWPAAAAAVVAVAAVVLAASALGCAAVLSQRAGAWDLVLMWTAVPVLLAAATTSTVSVRRSLA